MNKLHKPNYTFDKVDVKLIEALTNDARMSMRDLATLIGMSAPAATERLRRLTDAGVIDGFTLDVNPKALGYTLEAIVRIKPLPGQLHIIEKILQELAECTQCDKVTGDDCFIARISLRSIDVLDELMSPLKDRAETNTSIIHASPIRRRVPPILL